MKNSYKIILGLVAVSALEYSKIIAAEEKTKIENQQVGRFTLHIVNKGEQHILYRIDTVTGNVSIFDPNEKSAMSPEDWKQLSPQMQLAKEEFKKMGLFPYQLPFWRSLPEKLNGVTADGK